MEKKITELMKEDAKLIEASLCEYFKAPEGAPTEIYEAMRYSLLSGGKRIRPFLTLSFCRMHGGDDKAAIPFACAIETLHTYSLIHDDMPCLDDDDYRRGTLTNHKKFGEGMAMLCGDGMQASAYEIAASNSYVSAGAALDAVRLLASSAGPAGMVGGQVIDLIGESKKLTYEQLLHMNALKTCRFFRAACQLGCISAGINDKKAFTDAEIYADSLGLCFQLTDDLLDMATEKTDKTTFLTYMTAADARKLASELTEKAKEAISGCSRSEELISLADFLLTRTV